jgi:DnaK suppressor protein
MAERTASSRGATKSATTGAATAKEFTRQSADAAELPSENSKAAKTRAHKSVTATTDVNKTDDSPVQATPRATRSSKAETAEGATMVKPAESKAAKPAAKKGTRSAAETEKIRIALTARRDELQEEYDHTLAELAELQRDRLTDSAGDDQADTGTKTFEREQEITLANAILERTTQVERALERLDEGSYGWCERCGNPIPVERLAAFPSATLCVSCKQLEERR